MATLSVATPAISLPLDDDSLPHRDASEAFAIVIGLKSPKPVTHANRRQRQILGRQSTG
jgi:hypothetical protein